jgi:hypothetical protein
MLMDNAFAVNNSQYIMGELANIRSTMQDASKEERDTLFVIKGLPWKVVAIDN